MSLGSEDAVVEPIPMGVSLVRESGISGASRVRTALGRECFARRKSWVRVPLSPLGRVTTGAAYARGSCHTRAVPSSTTVLS